MTRVITRWEPAREFVTLRDAMDRLFEDSFVQPSWTALARRPRAASEEWRLPVDVYSTTEEVVIMAAVPGVNPENVEIRRIPRRAGERGLHHARAPPWPLQPHPELQCAGQCRRNRSDFRAWRADHRGAQGRDHQAQDHQGDDAAGRRRRAVSRFQCRLAINRSGAAAGRRRSCCGRTELPVWRSKHAAVYCCQTKAQGDRYADLRV